MNVYKLDLVNGGTMIVEAKSMNDAILTAQAYVPESGKDFQLKYDPWKIEQLSSMPILRSQDRKCAHEWAPVKDKPKPGETYKMCIVCKEEVKA